MQRPEQTGTGTSSSIKPGGLPGILATVEKRAWDAFRREECDYEKNGLLYCGKCNSPKVTVLHLPHGETIVPCMCDCENEKWEQMREAEREKSEEMKSRRLRSIGIRASLRDATFQNADPEVNQSVMNMARRYVEKWDQMRKEGIGFLFSGQPGNGKTYAAACIANALVDKCVPVMMTSFPLILEALAGLNRGDDRNGFLRSLDGYELLVIDDLGAERRTEYGLEIVFSVIDRRYVSGKPMLLTTNLTKEQMEAETDIALRRIYDRVLEMCIPVQFTRTSLRAGKHKKKTDFAREILSGKLGVEASGRETGADRGAETEGA